VADNCRGKYGSYRAGPACQLPMILDVARGTADVPEIILSGGCVDRRIAQKPGIECRSIEFY